MGEAKSKVLYDQDLRQYIKVILDQLKEYEEQHKEEFEEAQYDGEDDDDDEEFSDDEDSSYM